MLILCILQLDDNQSLPTKPLSSQAEAQPLSREHQAPPVEPQLLSEDSSTSKKDGMYIIVNFSLYYVPLYKMSFRAVARSSQLGRPGLTLSAI